MGKTKKTKAGVDLKSTLGRRTSRKPIWWLAILEGTRFQTFSFSWSSKKLTCEHDRKLPSFRELVEHNLRDSPGRSFDSLSRSQGGHQTGKPRHSYSSPLSPKKKILYHTATLAAKQIEQSRRCGAFDAIVIVAEPSQLGFLRRHLSSTTQKKIKAQIPKTVTKLSDQQRLKILTSYLPSTLEKAPRLLPNIHGA